MRKTIIFAGLALVIGIAIGHFSFKSGGGPIGETPDGNESGEQDILYWVAPMDPNFRRDAPGKSPMGMDLIPVYEGDAAGDDDGNALQISASVVNNIGVRTATATVTDLYREVNTVGIVTVDENKMSHVHVRSAGWIEKLNKKVVGERVRKGEVIFELYSPDLVAAQAEYLQALRLQNKPLAQAGAGRLLALGMTEKEVTLLESSGKTKERIEVLAPQDGVILEISVGEGMFVTPQRTVFSLADLSSVWVKAEVFEFQSKWVEEGQEATVNFAFEPEKLWVGTVDYIYPEVNLKSRTVQVRLELDNQEGLLKPNMYAEISIAAAPVKNALSIPREALIRTGKTDRLILALGEGKFRPAEVVAGLEVGDRVIIEKGLSEGEEIVTSGQFLLDSEASLNEAFLRMLDNDVGMNGADDMEEQELHHGMGLVVAVNEDGTVTLTHEPIESLNWPEMTMDFNVSGGVDLSAFEEGDRMHFMIKKSDEGPYIITSAMKM